MVKKEKGKSAAADVFTTTPEAAPLLVTNKKYEFQPGKRIIFFFKWVYD